MKEQDIHTELNAIRNLMERSAKFVSISGVSGILAGTYALIGAALGYLLVYGFNSQMGYRDHYVNEGPILVQLALIAASVLILALGTGMWLAFKKARIQQQRIWNPASRSLLFMVGVPLITGGILIALLIHREMYGIVAPASLIFYGLALVSGSPFTFKEIRWLGVCEIILGFLAFLTPGYGIIYWALGFGILHIVYGIIMHYRYDR